MEILTRTRFVVVVAFALLMTGCLSPSIAISIDPIVVNQGDDKVELDITFKMSGFSFDYNISKVTAVLVDTDDDEVMFYENDDAKISVPVIPGASRETTITIPLSGNFADLVADPVAYEEVLFGHAYELHLVLEGDKVSEATTPMIFK